MYLSIYLSYLFIFVATMGKFQNARGVNRHLILMKTCLIF